MLVSRLFNSFLVPPCFFIFLTLVGISLLIYCSSSFWMLAETPNYPSMTSGERTSLAKTISLLFKQHKLSELPSDDETKLIDLKNFKFTINHNDCNGTQLFLLIVVHSATENSVKRQVIRDTWANKTPDTRVFFFIGLNETSEENLQKENMKYQDIIQGNFIDTYRNLTYKHVMALKWITYHCSNAKYVLKTDDDVFVHHRALLDFLKHGLSPSGASRLILCNTNLNMPVIRRLNSRWRVSKKEYADKIYPTFCAGFVIIYSLDSVFLLYRQAQKEPYFWIDDVHVTGTIAKKVGLTHSSLGSLVMKYDRMEYLKKNNNSQALFLFGPVNLEEEEIIFLHRLSSQQHLPLLISYTGVKISDDSLYKPN